MIAGCKIARVAGFFRDGNVACLRRCAARRHRARHTEHRSTSTARSRFGDRTASSIEAFAAHPAPHPLRAEGELIVRDRLPAPAAGQRRRCQLDWRGRARDAGGLRACRHCVQRRWQVARRDRTGGPARAQGHQCRVGRGTGADRSGRSSQGGARQSGACASTPTSMPVRTPTFRPAFTSTSSACRSSRPATSTAGWRHNRGSQPVGIHVHLGSQIVSVEPIQRAAGAVIRLAQELRGMGIHARPHRHRRRARHFLRRFACAHCRRVCRRSIVDREALGSFDCTGARAVPRRRRGGAARTSHRPEGCARRAPFRRARCGYDGVDEAGALRSRSIGSKR